jgi:hypothetical protein
VTFREHWRAGRSSTEKLFGKRRIGKHTRRLKTANHGGPTRRFSGDIPEHWRSRRRSP